MRIKKVYQGNLADNLIVNAESNSQTNTYSCDYINNEPSAITLSLVSNTTLTIPTSYETVLVPLDMIKGEQDSNDIFTFSNNKLTINKAGRYLINANVMINSASTSQTAICSIFKTSAGGTKLVQVEGYGPLATASRYHTVSLSPVLISCAVGDVLSLEVSGSAAGDVTVAGARRFTFLTVTKL